MPLPRPKRDLPVAKPPSQIRRTTVKIKASEALDREEISRLAYELWQARGCPSGSAEIDWLQAEEQLRKQVNPKKSTPVKDPFFMKSAVTTSALRPVTRSRRAPGLTQVEQPFRKPAPEKSA